MAETNPEIEALVVQYGEPTVRAAFAIAQHIGDNGILGIDYSGAAEAKIRESAHGVVRRDVSDQCNQELRRL